MYSQLLIPCRVGYVYHGYLQCSGWLVVLPGIPYVSVQYPPFHSGQIST